MTGVAIATRPDPAHVISQKGKRFGPENVALRRGEHITVVNDNASFVHQAYIDIEEFAFDSGDIEPTYGEPGKEQFELLSDVHQN